MSRTRVAASILIGFSLWNVSFAWTSVQSDRGGYGRAIALFPNGDVVTTQTLFGPSPEPGDIAIVRLNGATGIVVWRYEQLIPSADDTTQVVVDPAGDVITANVGTATVMKLRGADGVLVWQATLPGTGAVRSFAVDAQGDVFTGGSVYTGPLYNEIFTKLSGADGSVIWSNRGPASEVHQVAVDAHGDLFVASLDTRGLNGAQSSVLRRISGASGFQIWEAALPGADTINESPVTARLDGAGRFVALLNGTLRNESPKFAPKRDGDSWWAVATVDADSGKLQWRTEVHDPNNTQPRIFATSLAVAPEGTVYVCGGFATSSGSTITSFSVVALDGVSGAERWRYLLGGGSLRASRGADVAMAPDGSVVATGTTSSKTDDTGFFMTRLRSRDGHPLWEKTFGATGRSTFDQGQAVVIDAGGAISAAGSIYVPFLATCPAVVKLDLNGASY